LPHDHRGRSYLKSPQIKIATELEQLIDYDSLRFQIELNFRDATQDWGVEDCMHVQQTAVNHAANFAVFMVNIAHLLLKPVRKDHPPLGILDLKAYFRGHTSVCET